MITGGATLKGSQSVTRNGMGLRRDRDLLGSGSRFGVKSR